MSGTMAKLRVYACVERAEIEAEGPLHPILAGGMNDEVWAQDPDRAERALFTLKEAFDPDGTMEWREFWVEVWESEVAGLFATETLDGYVAIRDANA